MKNTKRYLLAALALCMIVASMLLMVACGGSHKHDYTYKSVVTNPTCTERGYTTYTCKCGESKVDDYVDAKHDLIQHSGKPANCTEAGYEAYVTCKNCDYTTYKEIPAGEHYYDCSIIKIPTAEKDGKAIYTCEGCGDSYEAEISLEDIELPDVMGFVASIIGDGYYSIDLGDGFNLVMIKEITEDKEHYDYENSKWITDSTFEGTKTFLAVKLPKAYLDIKDAYMKAEIEIQVGTAEIGFDKDDNPEEISLVDFDVESSYSLKIDGNKFDVKLTSGEETEEYSATVYELALLLVSRYTGATLEYETMLEVYAVLQQLECFVPVFETVSEKLAALEQVESDVDFTALISILTALGSDVIEETVDGENTVYTLKLENLSKYVNYLKEATVSDILNDAFGEGFADSLKAFVVSIPTLTVKEIADAAIAVSETYGLNVDEFYALVNGAVYLYSGEEFDIAGEIDKRNGYTLAKIVAEMMGTPADGLDEAAASFTAQMEEVITMILGSTVDDLFEMLSSFGGEKTPVNPDGEEFTEELEPEEEKSLTEILEGFVALLGEEVEVTVVVDKNGNVKSADFSVSGMITGSYEVDENGDVNATLVLADFELEYSSLDGAYTVSLYAAGNKIVEGTVTVVDGGYKFDGKVYAGEITANLTVDIGLDGTLDVLLTVVGGVADVELSVKLDKENVDAVIKSGDRILFNLDVDMKDGKVVKVNVDAFNLTEEAPEAEPVDGITPPPTIKYEHAFGLYYLDNGEGTYTLTVKIPERNVVFDAKYDGANLDFVIKDGEEVMFSLYVDIADEKITAVDLDVWDKETDKKLKEEYVDDPLFSMFPEHMLPDDCFEIITTRNHVFSLDYTDNGNKTYNLVIAVPYDEVKVEFKLDLTNKTLTFKATEAENTVLDGTLTVTEDEITVNAKAYDEEETMDIVAKLSAAGLNFDIVIYANDEPEKKYTILDVEIVVENNVVTSMRYVLNAMVGEGYDEESEEAPEESESKLENILDATYTYTDNVATFIFKNGDNAEFVITATLSENGIVLDGLLKVFEDIYDDEGNVVDTEETVLFDGQIGFSVTGENGKHSFTVTADVDQIITDSYDSDYYYDYEADIDYYIDIINTLILAFDGEITFSYTEAK